MPTKAWGAGLSPALLATSCMWTFPDQLSRRHAVHHGSYGANEYRHVNISAKLSRLPPVPWVSTGRGCTPDSSFLSQAILLPPTAPGYWHAAAFRDDGFDCARVAEPSRVHPGLPSRLPGRISAACMVPMLPCTPTHPAPLPSPAAQPPWG